MKTITEQIIDAYDELDELLSRPSISDHALELIDKLRPKINSLIHQYREKRKWVNIYKLFEHIEISEEFPSREVAYKCIRKAIDNSPYLGTIEIIRP